ncbi:hypothetical protein CYY_000189 [Polysphondylium violaceum]|uniref:Uncharacterized protein n=1 Tax=Polysphondylium violaceum TaxID=133409 RepID=A0A8J4QBJ9_9MYCE|nr:hypothetical protein CYY_000189 [Polysphondylium violaceum]
MSSFEIDLSSSQGGNNGGGARADRATTMFTGDLNQQAVAANVQRELFKQLELLLLKKKAGEGKVTIRPGLLVTIPQVDKVSQLNSQNVTHSLEVISNVLVQISKHSLHSVTEVLVKMCDPYLDDYAILPNAKRPELPSFKEEYIESDCEISLIGTSSSSKIIITNSGNSIQVGSSSGEIPNYSPKPIHRSPSVNLSDEAELSPSLDNDEEREDQDDTEATTVSSNISAHSLSSLKQVSEDTPLYHLLNTLYLVLLSHQPNLKSTQHDPESQLSTLPSKVLTFLFNLLQYTYPAAIRYKSASCLQVISSCSLESITTIYITKLQSGKSDDFYREFSSVQKTAKFLEFGFYRRNQIEATNQYFAKMQLEMEKASRAVFVQSVCYTICKAFPRMFNSSTPLENVPDSFWTIAKKMYDIIWKWTKKSKLKPICIRTLFAMVGCSQEFLSSKSTDLLNLFSTSYKETSSKATRKSYLECIIQYIGHVKSVFGTEAKAPFYQNIAWTNILPIILPKKTTPHPTESPLILEVLLSMGRFSLGIVVSKYLTQMLLTSQKTEYSLESKAIVFKMLHRLNIEFPEQMRGYDRAIWASLDPLFITYEGEATPMKYLLLNFPAFCSHENLKEVADKITKWTWHSEPDIATMSTVGISKYLSSQPHSTFPSILLQMLTYITNYTGDLSGLCKVVKNMCLVTQEFINLHYLPNKERKMSASTGIDQTTWKNLRDTCEGVSLYLLSSTITPLWSEVFEFIQLTGHEIFREIDESLKLPYLADFLPASASHVSIPEQHLQALSQLIPTFDSDLNNFLQIHTGNFTNCLGWSWARLRKRWHPKSQPIGWKNNLAFLLLSIRLNSASPEITAVEDQLLTEVLTCYFQEREGKTNEELCQFISDVSLYLHSSCYDTVFRFIEQERSRDLKRKKKETFYIQDHVIIFASQLVDRLSVEDFDSIPSIRPTLREMTYFWITNPNTLSSLSLQAKNHTSRLLKNFFSLDSKSTLPKGEISLNKASYTKLIFHCLQILSSDFVIRDNIVKELEVNVQKLLQILLSEANLNDFKKEIIPYLQKCSTLGDYIYPLISENLGIFLRRSPKHLNEYIEKCFNNEEQPVCSLLFLRALVNNFSPEYYLKWNHNCPPERLALLCLFHMVSNDDQARSLSIQLSNDLAMREVNSDDVLTSLAPHFQVIYSSNLPLHIYLRSSLLYSNSMSTGHTWVTPGLFEEADHFYKFMPFGHKQTILTLLAPWTRNFWLVLNASEGLSSRSVNAMLDALFSLTIQAKESSLSNLSSLEILWGELVSSGDQYKTKDLNSTELIVEKVIDFLMEKYHHNPTTDKKFPYSSADAKQGARMVMSFISRRSSTHWPLVVDYMVKLLRHYSPLPQSPVQFVEETVDTLESIVSKSGESSEQDQEDQDEQVENNNDPEESTNLSQQQKEEALLAFFDDLAFEFQYQDIITLPELIPTLLSNILFVYGPNSPGAVNGKKILNNILLSLVIQQTSIAKEIKSESNTLIHSDWKRWKAKQKTSLLKILYHGIGESILEIWEKMTLQFAVRAKEAVISLSALGWYGIIRSTTKSKRDGMDGLLGLSCGLWTSTLTGEFDKIHKYIVLFTEIVNSNQTTKTLSETSYAIIVRLTSVMLHTSYIHQFQNILILLYQTFQSLEDNTKSGDVNFQPKILEEMVDILGAGMKPEQIVNRGIAHPKTSMLTLWFAKQVSNFWQTKKSKQSSSITCACMLSAAMMITMSPEDPNTRDFIEYLYEAPVSTGIAKMLPLLHSHYHYSVAKTPGAPALPATATRDLARSLCRELIDYFPDSPDLISGIINSVNEMIKSLIEFGGKEQEMSFLLFFMNELLMNHANGHPSVMNIQSQVLLDFINLMIDLSQRSNSLDSREEAQKTIPFILNNIPQGLPLGSFDFLKPFDSISGVEAIYPGAFGSHNDRDITNNVHTCLYLVNTYLYAVPQNSFDMKNLIDYHYQPHLKVAVTPVKKVSYTNPPAPSSSSMTKSISQEFLNKEFQFSFKKRVNIPKPSQLLFHQPMKLSSGQIPAGLGTSSSSSVMQIVTPPSPHSKKPISMIKQLSSLSISSSSSSISHQPMRPSTPPPSISKLNSSSSSLNTSTTSLPPPPAIPPKRIKKPAPLQESTNSSSSVEESELN